MKIFKNFIGLAALALCLGFASCDSDDDAPSYSNVAVSNSELMTILKGKGYQFDENGKMLLDDKANSTTSLDLSGTKVDTAALKELSVFPNLKELNLSSNGYGPVFHIASLPSQITGLDLQGNDIYDFDGLVTAKVENDEVKATILHEFTKLYLPASCKYNVEDLMPFYTQNEAENKTVDMQMVNDKGSLEKYNTLREIPDEYFRAYLKQKFASLFTDDTHIDISKPMKNSEQGESIHLWYSSQYENIDKINSIEGVEYFVNNPYYQDFYVSIGYTKHYTIGYIMPGANIKGLQFTNISTPNGVDLTKAKKLANVTFGNDDYLTSLDLSNTVVANQQLDDIDATVSNMLQITNCKNLSSLMLPKDPIGIINTVLLSNLPSLNNVDLSSIKAISTLCIFQMHNASIKYPALTNVYYAAKNTLEELASKHKISFCLSKNVFEKSETQNFITSYKASLRDRYYSYEEYDSFPWSENI